MASKLAVDRADMPGESMAEMNCIGSQDQMTVTIGGIPVRRYSAAQWCELMLEDVRLRRAGLVDRAKVVTTANGQVVSLFASDPAFQTAMLASDYVAADGMSIVNASRKFTHFPLPERVATTDWFHDAARVAQLQGLRFYILGGLDEVNRKAIARMREMYPHLQIVGSRDGYFTRAQTDEIVADINRTKADILWLGIGNPRQLVLAQQIKHKLETVAWIRTCGGLYDHVAGIHRRAPKAFQKLGMEWACRVMLEPRRLFWRYLTTNVHAMWRMRFHSR